MGFVFLYYSPVHLHKFRLLDGQILYFRSFFYGLVFFFSSLILMKILDKWGFSYDLAAEFNSFLKIEYSDFMGLYFNLLSLSAILELLTILFAHFGSRVGIFLSIFLKIEFEKNTKIKDKFTKIYDKTKFNLNFLPLLNSLDSELDRMLLESIVDKKPLIIHMQDRKMYIGFVQEFKVEVKSKVELQTFSFVPLRSGYRDKDNLTVEITTEYNENNVFQIVFLKENIISVTYYDKEIFDDFINKKKSEKNTSFFKKILKKTPH